MIENLVLASGNAHKAAESEAWFCERGWNLKVHDASKFGGMDGCVESADDFEGNAKIKAKLLLSKVPEDHWVLADDSGLVVDSLGGAPGVYSARFAGEGATDRQNRELLLERMRKVSSERKRSARFVCVLALAQKRKKIRIYRGECEGRILTRADGAGGFGYDPIFAPKGARRSFARFEPSEKNKISHRGLALEKLEKDLTP